jgi:hypothetical protein
MSSDTKLRSARYMSHAGSSFPAPADLTLLLWRSTHDWMSLVCRWIAPVALVYLDTVFLGP